MGGSQARRIGKRNRVQAENQVQRRETSLFLRAHGATPEQYRFAQRLKANRMDREPVESSQKMSPEERKAWEEWQKQNAQARPTGFANINMVEKKRPEQRQ